jgi:hypothetical protein
VQLLRNMAYSREKTYKKEFPKWKILYYNMF